MPRDDNLLRPLVCCQSLRHLPVSNFTGSHFAEPHFTVPLESPTRLEQNDQRSANSTPIQLGGNHHKADAIGLVQSVHTLAMAHQRESTHRQQATRCRQAGKAMHVDVTKLKSRTPMPSMLGYTSPLTTKQTRPPKGLLNNQKVTPRSPTQAIFSLQAYRDTL